MGSVVQLGKLLGCPELAEYSEPGRWFSERNQIKSILTKHLKTKSTAKWLEVLEAADYWCADVLSWEKLFQHEGFKILEMIQTVESSNTFSYETTRCPIKIDGQRLFSKKGAPKPGEQTESVLNEL